jgi:hypothetical protein
MITERGMKRAQWFLTALQFNLSPETVTALQRSGVTPEDLMEAHALKVNITVYGLSRRAGAGHVESMERWAGPLCRV